MKHTIAIMVKCFKYIQKKLMQKTEAIYRGSDQFKCFFLAGGILNGVEVDKIKLQLNRGNVFVVICNINIVN